MDPNLSNGLIQSFNKFLKEIFHSSTLSLTVKRIGVNDYHFVAKGISNRFIKQLVLQKGETFTNQILEDIFRENTPLLYDYIYDNTKKKMMLSTIHLRSSFDYFKVILREIP